MIGPLAALFFAFGVVAATWISRIPSVAADLALSPGLLGLALLGFPIGSIAASLLMPRMMDVTGRRAAAVAMPLAAATLVPTGFADGPVTLGLALIAFGAATGALDVAANTLGVAVERRAGRSIFARLHAMWSLGAFVGAVVGAAFAAATASPREHFAIVAGITVVATVPLLRRLPHELDVEPAPPPGGVGWTRDRRVLVLASSALAALVIEVTAADWGGVFVRRELGAGATTAAAAFAAFSLLHFGVRVGGDRVVDRLPRSRLLSFALAAAGAGLTLVALSPVTAVAFAGLALTGGAVALVFPVAVAAAGSVRGVMSGAGVATAAGLSYVGWSLTPPVIGGVASAANLRVALLCPVVVAATAVVALRRHERGRAAPP